MFIIGARLCPPAMILASLAARRERGEHGRQRVRRLVGKPRRLHGAGSVSRFEPARLIEQMQPLRHDAERHLFAFPVVRLLVHADKDVAAFDLETKEAVGADRQHRTKPCR